MAYLVNRMVRVGVGALGIASALVACGTGAPEGGNGPVGPASEARTEREVENLRQAFPKARLEHSGTRLARVFGSKLSTGRTSLESAERFRVEHGLALGAQPDELEPEELQDGKPVATNSPNGIGLMYDPATGQHRFTLYRYGQKRAGLRVYRGGMRTVVKNGGDNPVVWASSNVKPLNNFFPKSGVVARSADRDKTLAAIRGATDFSGNLLPTPKLITNIGKSELVVYAGTEERDAEAKLAIEYSVDTDLESFEVVADAETGDVLHVERGIVFENVVGTVTGNVTQGFKATECADEVPINFPFAEVALQGGASVFTDATGAFTLPNAGTAAVTVQSPVGGQYFDVVNYTPPNELLSQSIVPPGPAAFLHNPTNDITTRAQANGYANSNQVRAFLLNYLPSYPTISSQVNFPVYVNRTDGYCPGNAWYDYVSINFCVGSSSYGNTSFASVNHHEYGHHIVTSGGSGQGAYGEGMSDVVAALLAGDPGLGYGFYLNQCSTPLRNADNNCQYSPTACSSCGSEAHACGNLISGAIWSVRKLLAISEPSTYVDLLNSLVLSSIPMHTGTSITPQIAIDLLTLDDDDGNLDNGTPHYEEICGGFQAHGMSCPPIVTGLSVSPASAFSSAGPLGGPFTPGSQVYTLQNLGPQASIAYHVTPSPAATWLSVSNATGTIALGASVQVTASVNQDVAASLAKGKYSTTLQFVNDTSGAGNTTRLAELEAGGPTSIFQENFEGGLGQFTLGTESQNLWHVSSACTATLPGHSTPNALYFGIDATCNFSNGSTVLGTATSSLVQVTDTTSVKAKFNYLIGTEGGASYDHAAAQLSVNGGAFTTIASNNQGGQTLIENDGVWHAAEIDVTPLFSGLSTATAQLRFRFDSGDSAINGNAGFLVDDVELKAFTTSCTTDAQCNDGAYCNGVETCVAGSCTAGTSVDCNDGVTCTQDSCVEATDSCTHVVSDTACSDGNACNGAETCNATTGCQAGTPITCDDGSVCTADSCSPTSGCVYAPISCDDGNACTAEACDAVTGCSSSPVNCDDGSLCTTDSCNTSTGCVNAPITCNDGDACTTDSCNPASGCSTAPVVCNDNNACTTDSCNSSTGCTYVDNGSCTNGPFQESGGQVVMEGEHFFTTVTRSSHTWTLTSNSSASGGQVMSCNPNNGANINTGYATTSPELTYQVNFTTTGTYQVWIRGIGPNQDGDSLHAGIDGTAPLSADRISSFGTSLTWSKNSMENTVVTLNVTTPGVHTINIWMREDGFILDKILLTTSTSFTPTGAGPAESPKGPVGSCTSNAQCNDNNPCTNDACTSGTCTYTNNTSSCTDDGNVCTNDVCSAGACTHPNNTNACASDGNSCTNDVCSAGVCTHPQIPGCTPTGGPCANVCSNPIAYTTGSSGNLGTGASCYQTTSNLAGGNCGNFTSPRTLSVNGTTMSCNNQNWPSLPAKVNGGYCINISSGNQPWAYFTTW